MNSSEQDSVGYLRKENIRLEELVENLTETIHEVRSYEDSYNNLYEMYYLEHAKGRSLREELHETKMEARSLQRRIDSESHYVTVQRRISLVTGVTLGVFFSLFVLSMSQIFFSKGAP